ncbi:aminoglycoside phosphotransferase family protein [Streptomyces sp. XM4011]|uniref:aminoglycoside phosphotransferase family protein n=1 Tax=Streptomyces sp. XM4011 TaxID=2929780 RepID=UPI001FF9737A|nr:aminoglycoside phosphotransferase family protein [Streptomyces sp. XM4011]MCK1816344.1 aminoglycoside phosphotransferase family protein [Streptomyces sp. XM4011]
MTRRTLGDVPSGCRERLLAHYGPSVEEWLDAAPRLLAEAARRWNLSLRSYHDAGHASAVALAMAPDGSRVVLKAWVEPIRYRHETAALRVWAGGPTANLVHAADDLSVAALQLVGGQAGGDERPVRQTQAVAAAIHRLHMLGRRTPEPGVPSLAGFLHEVVLPRVHHRMGILDLDSYEGLARKVRHELADLSEVPARTTVLHADLYAENVIFDVERRPRLIDPHPVEGDAVFDWAFWSVYYDLERGMADRLATAARISRIPVPEITPWCRALALDGLLYYTEIGDPARPKIAAVLSSLMTCGAGRYR